MLVIGPVLYNYTGTAGFTAVYDRQYAATLSFTDAKSVPLNPAPAYVTLQGHATGTSTISGYSGQYITADLYTVISARWQGADIPTTTTQTLDLTHGPAAATISLKAYQATIHIVDNHDNRHRDSPTGNLRNSILPNTSRDKGQETRHPT